jgi:multidrug resistance efflux pump
MSKSYIEKQSKIKEENLKYDFLPSMLEIIEKPENKMSTVIIILVLALLITSVIWAAFAKTNIVVTAQGSVIPKGNLIAATTIYGGEVSEICVEEGQGVKKGDLLLSIDSTKEQEDKDLLEYELDILVAQKESYEKIKECREAKAEMDNEEENSIENYGIDVIKYGDNASVAETIIAEENLYELQLKEYNLAISDSQNKKLAETQKEEFIAQRDLTILQSITSLEVKIRDAENSIDENKRIIEQKRLYANADGIITNLSVNTVGQVVQSGAQAMYIIPSDEELIFKAYVRSADIEGVEEGDKVSVRVAALKDTDYSRIEGNVIRIEDAAVNVDGLGNVYQVDVRLDDVPREFLKVGQEGSCDISIGERTILNYFMEPFIDGFKESMHER